MSSYERRCNIPNYLMLKPKIEYGEDDLLPPQYVFARPCEPRLWLKEPNTGHAGDIKHESRARKALPEHEDLSAIVLHDG